jgi:hypothetical protein
MPALFGGNFAADMARVFSSGCHELHTGDSQSSHGRGYLWSVWPMVSKIDYGYFTCAAEGTAGDIPDTASFPSGAAAGTTITKTGKGNNRTDEILVTNVPVIRPSEILAFAGPATASTALSNGLNINKVLGGPGSGTPPQYPWPPLASNSGRPWFHGSAKYIKGRWAAWKSSGLTVEKWAFTLRRTDQTTSHSAAAVQADLTAAANGIRATAWSATLIDSNDHTAYASTSIANDHDVQMTLAVSSDAAYDESLLTFCPIAGTFTRCASDGTVDTTLPGYDFFGRAGATADDWYNGFGSGPTAVDQTTWQQYLAATVLNPVIVDFCMLGHNQAASEVTGGNFNATFATNYAGWINRKKAAAVAAGFTYYPVLIVPWMGVGSAITTQAKCDALQDLTESVAASVGGSWCSFYRYFGANYPFQTLHPAGKADGLLLSNALLDMANRATDFRYSTQGTTRKTFIFD